MQRLAFIKAVYTTAVSQSQAPEPLNSMAVLSFHDAVELFLQLSAEYLNANTDQLKFMEYWDVLSKRIQGDSLQQKESMRRLNKSRVTLKHHGTLPSKLDIESFRASATSFFEDNTPLIFNESFSNISLVELISPVEAKDFLREAQALIGQKKYTEALDQIALSFDVLLRDYEKSKKAPFYSSPFTFGDDLSFIDFDFPVREKEGFDELRSYMKRITDTLVEMQNGMKIMALGINYRRYGRFKYYMPSVSRAESGRYQIIRNQRQNSFSYEEVQYCFDFVIQSALLLREFDYKAPEIELNIPNEIPSFR